VAWEKSIWLKTPGLDRKVALKMLFDIYRQFMHVATYVGE